jgi:hypothetical protein
MAFNIHFCPVPEDSEAGLHWTVAAWCINNIAQFSQAADPMTGWDMGGSDQGKLQGQWGFIKQEIASQ